MGREGNTQMANGVVEAPSEGYHDCTQECAQAHYDRAAWDYLNWLNGLTREERNRHFAEDKRLDWYLAHQRPSPRCTKCGNTVLERRWSSDHVDWQCLEATCREFWEWRAK